VPIVSLDQAISSYLDAARLTNPDVRFAGVALNTSSMNAEAAEEILSSTSRLLDLPCVDPIRTGVDPIVAALETFHAR
jgi:uncharacterized NAD-dependent epimerase/dehydratase family protein